MKKLKNRGWLSGDRAYKALYTEAGLVFNEQLYLQDTTKAIRTSVGYRDFRYDVLSRDGFMCRKCQRTKDLHVHHVKSFKRYPENRLEPKNGVTLCKKCHQRFHKVFTVKTFEPQDTFVFLDIPLDPEELWGIKRP